ncbi:phosphopantetheine-binding protein [Neisseria elongata]|uniref:phosphopantetheine-binding protein n=1 Tax=Neisseria elongata TaxID=495 RepID=UPI0024B25476|nr:phosphopantetheine-binding protein [Neisseria elongata]
MNDLKQEIKQLIIDSLGLEDLTPADIGDEETLFGDSGLGLDSVDALELGLAVQKHFGFQLDGENQELRDSFANVSTLATFVQKQRG